MFKLSMNKAPNVLNCQGTDLIVLTSILERAFLRKIGWFWGRIDSDMILRRKPFTINQPKSFIVDG